MLPACLDIAGRLVRIGLLSRLATLSIKSFNFCSKASRAFAIRSNLVAMPLPADVGKVLAAGAGFGWCFLTTGAGAGVWSRVGSTVRAGGGVVGGRLKQSPQVL